jgi:GAF domain-containing protein
MEAQSLHYLNEVSARLDNTPGKPGDLVATLRHIARVAQESFHTDACVIIAFNPITGKYIGYQTFLGDRLVENELAHEKPRPAGVTEQVLRDRLLVIEDLESHPFYQNRFTRQEGIRSFAGVALRTRHRQRPLGVLYLDFKEPRKFSTIDRESYQIYAVQASFLLQETWLASHYVEVARIGQEVNHNLSTVDELFQILQTYVETVLDETHTLLLSVYHPQTYTQDIYLSEEHRIHIRKREPLKGACEYIINTQQSFFINSLSDEAAHLPFQIISLTGAKEKESFIFTPLMLRGSPLGVLSIQHDLPKAYGQEDQFVLQLLASYIALALHNIRLYSSLNQLKETGQLLTRLLESEHTLQAIAEQIRTVTQADVVVLYPYEPLPKRFANPPCVAGELWNSSLLSMSPTRSDDMAYLMLRQERPIFAKESAELYTILQGDIHLRQGDFQEREQIRSTAALPLRVGEDIVGVLFLNFRQPQRFDATQKLLIEGLAHYAATGMKNAQVFGTLSLRRVQELTILQHIDRELSKTLDLNTVLHTLLELAHEHVPAEEASILLHDAQTQMLVPAAAISRNADASLAQSISLQQAKGITRWVVEQKQSVRVNNVRKERPWKNLHVAVADDTISELDVPLLDGDEVVGVLNFESTREAAFSQEDEEFLRTLSGQAVLAIKNAQAYAREKRLLAEAEVLNQISKELAGQLDLNRVFDLILENALALTRAELCSLMLYEPEQNSLLMVAERGAVEGTRGLRHTLDQGISGYVAKTRQPLNADPSQPPWNTIYLEISPATRSELAVPLLAGSELRGVLNVESPLPQNFSERDERLLSGLADLAVVALQNAQAYAGEKRLVEESQALNAVSKEITSQLDLQRVFQLILEKALQLTRCSLGSLHLYDPESAVLTMEAERGVDKKKQDLRLPLTRGIIGYIARNRELVNVRDVRESPWNSIYEEFIEGTRAELAVPMLAGSELRGVLNVESPVPGHFNESDERLLKGLADLAVVALQNAERYKKAESDTQRFELLYKAGQQLSEITDLAQIERAYTIVVQIAATQSQSQSMIYRYDEIRAELVLACTSPYGQALINERITPGEGLNGYVAQKRETLVIHDRDHLPEDITTANLADPGMHSYIITPIVFKDQYYGNLDLRHPEIGHFRGADILFFEGLAQQLANTIHRLEMAKARLEFEQRVKSSEEMSTIGQSAYEVTHRLGNDLGLVKTYVEEIQEEMKELDVSSVFIDKKLGSILEDVQKVLSFSIDLKEELAKLGAHDEKAGEPLVIAPAKLLEEAAKIVASSPGIELHLDIDKDVANVSVFPDLVADILQNLVTNAIQAMPSGGKLTLRACNAEHFVALQVSDTGVGIAENMLPRIFDLFFSLKGSSGFGLWSARRNALKNHGDLKAESKPGEGTTFTLLLPRANGNKR